MAPAGTSAEAIRAHYDLCDDFFGLWLGEEKIYSCALFEPGDDLYAAQLRKLDYHIEQAAAAGASRVLDVGCGWGALLRRLVRTGVSSAAGLTLSRTQGEQIARDAIPGTAVHVEPWEAYVPDAPYDAIISIGAFEHFATRDMTTGEKGLAYRRFFEFCHRNLRRRGRISLQTVAYMNPGEARNWFVPTTIFRESELPFASEILAASEPLFEIAALRNDRMDYMHTCRSWARNLAARRDDAVRLVGDEVTRDYEQYLTLAAAFKAGAVCLLRLTLIRSK
jgi:cyclopropane-fatty-acyl-phospholipid synthase